MTQRFFAFLGLNTIKANIKTSYIINKYMCSNFKSEYEKEDDF